MSASRLRTVVGRPALHVMAGILFLCLLTWPLFAVVTPWVTFVLLQLTWMSSIALLAIASFGEDMPEDDEDDAERTDSAAGSVR